MDSAVDIHGEVTRMTRKTYRKPELQKLGLLRKLTRFSF
jgi:hypothetical protein